MTLLLSITFLIDFIDSVDLLDRLSELRCSVLEDGLSCSGDSVLLPGSGSSSLGTTSCNGLQRLIYFDKARYCWLKLEIKFTRHKVLGPKTKCTKTINFVLSSLLTIGIK